jgi:polyisoprenoid-binding protein YceI
VFPIAHKGGHIAAQPAPPLPVSYELDADHSEVAFTVRFMGLSTVRGAFADVRGSMMVAADDPVASSISVVITSASINTNSVPRDRHLRSPDFFDVARYPTITFRSARIERAAEGYAAVGPLVMHGVTREVRIPFTMLHGKRTDAWGNTRIGARGRLTLNRKDYGIEGTAFWNNEFDPGRMAVGNDVEIELLVEGVVRNFDRVQMPRADSLLKAATAQGPLVTAKQFRDAALADSTLRRASEAMLSNAGRKALQHGDTSTAVELLGLSSELNPGSAAAAAYYGEALRLAGRPAEARTAFERALAADPAHPLGLEGVRVTAR